MKIQIDRYTPVPTISIIGCEKSFGCEHLKIVFSREWRSLKKYVTLYPTSDDTDAIVIEYKKAPIELPERIYEKAGVCRYVISGEGKNKRIVSKTGYMTVLKAPEPLPDEYTPDTKKRKGVAL